MTHSGGKPHTNVGDRGQRFEVRAAGWPFEHESAIGWTMTVDAARSMCVGTLRAPGCKYALINDRETKETIFKESKN